MNPFILANKTGIPKIESISVVESATNVQFNFHNHSFMNSNFSGLVLVKLTQPIPSTTTQTLPIVFGSVNGSSVPLVKAGGDTAKVSDITTGVFLVFYEHSTNTLQLI